MAITITKFDTLKLKKDKQQYIKDLLAGKLGDERVTRYAIFKGLLTVYSFQTEDEKAVQNTKDKNNVGFTGFDGEILTSFRNQFVDKGKLSEKQYAILKKKMQKYWKQLYRVAIGDLILEKAVTLPQSLPEKWVYNNVSK